MTPLTLEPIPRANRVQCTGDELQISLTDGHRRSVPLLWSPRLASAAPADRDDDQLLSNEGIHWPNLDEDISVAGSLAGR